MSFIVLVICNNNAIKLSSGSSTAVEKGVNVFKDIFKAVYEEDAMIQHLGNVQLKYDLPQLSAVSQKPTL